MKCDVPLDWYEVRWIGMKCDVFSKNIEIPELQLC